MKTLKTLLFLSLLPFLVISQESSWRWQQEVDYTMVIDVNVENHTYKGTQNLVFTNNSPDDLDRVFLNSFIADLKIKTAGSFDLAGKLLSKFSADLAFQNLFSKSNIELFIFLNNLYLSKINAQE